MLGIPDIVIHAHALNGIIHGHASTGESLHQVIQLLAGPTADVGSNLVVRRCPTAWKKKSLPVWGRPGSDRDLMRHVKRTLDPQNVFNPGRLFGDV